MLDYGGQYSQLIARRVRDCGVFSELLPHHMALEEIARRNPRGIILSGGPASVYAEGAPALERGLLELGIPVMGICYGMQLLVHTLGGRVEQAEIGEFGRSDLTVAEPGVLMAGMPAGADLLDVPPRHRLRATAGLHGAGLVERVAGRGGRGHRSGASTASSSTPRSSTPLRPADPDAFLTEVCGCERDWSPASIVEEQVAADPRAGRAMERSSAAFPAASTPRVAALLVHRAVGDQLTCVFVDHGLMRKDEGEQVVSTFRDTFKVPLVGRRRRAAVPREAQGVTEPEAKRKAIGAEFIRVFEEEAPEARRRRRRASSCRGRCTRT